MSAPEHPRHPEHMAPVLGAGLGFLLAGGSLLLQELGLLTLRWSTVLPAILIAVGVVTVLAGAVGAAGSRDRYSPDAAP